MRRRTLIPIIISAVIGGLGGIIYTDYKANNYTKIGLSKVSDYMEVGQNNAGERKINVGENEAFEIKYSLGDWDNIKEFVIYRNGEEIKRDSCCDYGYALGAFGDEIDSAGEYTYKLIATDMKGNKREGEARVIVKPKKSNEMQRRDAA